MLLRLSALRGSDDRRRALLIIAVGMLAAVAAGAGHLSLAVFGDQETVAATFGSGTVDLDGNQIDQLSLSLDPMMPGDAVTDGVVVANVGTAELRYAVSTASTNSDGKGLRDALTLTIKGVDVTTPASPCNDFDGPTLVATASLGSAGGLGSPAAGAQAGDRTLAAGDSETLCVRVALPLSTDEAYAGATTTTTFTFAAEQTANNP